LDLEFVDMKQEDITRMAREAGFVGFDGDNGSLRRFAALVAASEREACARMVEDGFDFVGDQLIIAEAIRARGQA
jgi:hypothetical protein